MEGPVQIFDSPGSLSGITALPDKHGVAFVPLQFPAGDFFGGRDSFKIAGFSVPDDNNPLLLGEFEKLPGIKPASVFADELAGSVMINIEHSAAGRPWYVLGAADDAGYWHLRSAAPIGLDYRNSRLDYQVFELVLHETEFRREIE